MELLASTGLLLDFDYLIGLGSYDITGPAADVNMMGYANAEQIASGIHFRLRVRSFIVAEPKGKRVVFVNLDACMASQLVTIRVIERLKTRYGKLYTEQNVASSGIHTHAGPAGYLQYVTYLVTPLGFIRQSFDVLVDGIEKRELLDAGVNRSPSAYLDNPASERRKYKYDVDNEMTLLKFVDEEWGPVGSFNWFATHGTSMSRTNSLISGDNKESQISCPPVTIILKLLDADHELLELAASFLSSPGRPATRTMSVAKSVRGTLRQADKPGFVSAFCQRNCGDVSPNVLRAFCIDTGLPCDFNHSTCGGKNELCYGRGPGYPDEFESTRSLEKGNSEKLWIYLLQEQLMDLGHLILSKEMTREILFWRLVRNLLKTPDKKQVDCPHPKPILLDTGEMKLPYDWAPSILPIQIIWIEQLVILSVPGDQSLPFFVSIKIYDNVWEASPGCCEDSAYKQWVPLHCMVHTLSAYIQEFQKLASALIKGQLVEASPQPPDLLKKQISLLTPVVMDSTPAGINFGDVIFDVPVNSTFKTGKNVTVAFWSACSRNDLLTEGTFALVEMLQGKDTWIPMYDDEDWCLRFTWTRPSKLSPISKATIGWTIPPSASPGVYRIRHFGASKGLLGSIRHFTGSSSAFVVT
ncbi:Neutral ceramidase [Hibiscus syriacus]|uniref:Neutral ceramidase n=1 Tax=Hibiscus syriacus TaxID=106335 RepID=A0A6A2ZXA4_HIBSY|nr:Neutral ceramidase [Hibiscus syriacus]